MKITVHDFAGHPFQAQLSRELARRGHVVVHRWSPDVASGQGALVLCDDDPDGLSFSPVEIGREFERYQPLQRLRDEGAYARSLMHGLAVDRPDVVLSGNTPITVQARLVRWARRQDVAAAFWLQDVLSIGSAEQLESKLGPIGSALGAGLRAMEQRSLRNSDAVVSITDGFDQLLDAWSVPRERRTVIENWTPLEEVQVRPRDNAWADEHGLGERPVFVYAGTLGLKHDPGAIAALVREVGDAADVVVVSEGIGSDWLREHAAEHVGENLHLLPYQPWERVPDVLGSADVLLALLEPEAGVFSVPSKVLTAHAAGRPQLAAIPSENLAAQILRRERTGVVVEPGDHASFARAGRELLERSEELAAMGERARAYAERAFDIEAIGARFERVLTDAVERKR